MISKEEINEIINTDGETRGVTLYTDAEYVRHHWGQEALRHVEEATREMGYPVDYSKVKAMDWYPMSLRSASLLVIKKIFKLDDDHLREMGRAAPKYSIITKLMLRYLVSPETLMKKVGTYWRKNYSHGSLTGEVIDKSVFLYLRDFRVPVLAYPYIEGYFASALGIVIGDHHNITTKMEQLPGEVNCYKLVLRW